MGLVPYFFGFANLNIVLAYIAAFVTHLSPKFEFIQIMTDDNKL